MKYSQLIEKCKELIESYNSDIMTPDSHADQFLGKLKCEDTERVFLKQVFYGCERYGGFLKASNAIVFQKHSSITNRKTDATIFCIFTYLVCFRLDELPYAQFQKMVMGQNMVKMNVLLSFLFNLEQLVEIVFPVWSQHLELSYLEGTLLPKLQQRKIKCEQFLIKVSQMATGKRVDDPLGTTVHIQDTSRSKPKCTIPQAFNLTKPKPKAIPQLQKIQVGFHAKKPPKLEKNLDKIEAEKQQRRQEIRQNTNKYYQENAKQMFQFETMKRPTNLANIKQQVAKKKANEMKKYKPIPMPSFNEVDVKLNVAAILREEKKLKEKIQEEELRIKNLEINMRDETAFENWKKEMKQKDNYQQLEAQQIKKVEMELAREAAVKAYQERIQEKRCLVEGMNQLAKDLKKERKELQQREIEEKRKIVEGMQEIQSNINQQKEKVVQRNKKVHDEEIAERKRIQELKKQQAKTELQKKKELIAEIRELEKKAKAKPKQQIAHTSLGLLDQCCSIQELQARLAEVKKRHKEQESNRRQNNLKKKEQFNSVINQKKQAIMAHRQELAQEKERERRQKRQQLERQQKKKEEAKAKSMSQYKMKEEKKVQERKREKKKLDKQIKETEQRRKFLMQGQAALEANAFKNLEMGEEREIIQRQNNKLVQEYKKQAVQKSDDNIIAMQNQKIVKEKIDFNQLYNQRQAENNLMSQTLQQEDQTTKAMKYDEVRTFEEKHKENMLKQQPYRAKISQMSLSLSKKAK